MRDHQNPLLIMLHEKCIVSRFLIQLKLQYVPLNAFHMMLIRQNKGRPHAKTRKNMVLLQRNNILIGIKVLPDEFKLAGLLHDLHNIRQVLLRLNDVSREGERLMYLPIPKGDLTLLRFDDALDLHICEPFVIVDGVSGHQLDTQWAVELLLERLDLGVVLPSVDGIAPGLVLVPNFERHPVAGRHSRGYLGFVLSPVEGHQLGVDSHVEAPLDQDVGCRQTDYPGTQDRHS